MTHATAALAARHLTASAHHLGVRVSLVIDVDTVILSTKDRQALTRAIQQRDDQSIDGNHARRLLNVDRALTALETAQLALDLDRIVTAAQRADKLRRGIIPGALSGKEVSDLYRRGFLR